LPGLSGAEQPVAGVELPLPLVGFVSEYLE
jgi:hypothetical protein